jgi:hypothetical protein
MQTPDIPNPAGGGSYTRDPVTGELQRVQHTRPALPKGWTYDDNDQPVEVTDTPPASAANPPPASSGGGAARKAKE